MRHVHLYPEEFFFPAGGAAVHHLAAEGDFTFARLTRKRAATGCTSCAVLRALRRRGQRGFMRQSTYVWPHAFAKIDAGADEILSRYGSNHIHAIPGDHVEELLACHVQLPADLDYDGFGSAKTVPLTE